MSTARPHVRDDAAAPVREASSPPGPDSRAHDTDRALTELLGEVRIAQMGGQILLGFLLAVAYTPVMAEADDGERTLYAWAVLVTTASVVLLLAPVPLHRINFGRRDRPEILVVGHALTLAGTVLLAAAIVLGVWLAAEFALEGLAPRLVGTVSVLLVAVWFVLPIVLRLRRGPRDHGPPQ